MNWESPKEFGIWFYNTFMDPAFDLMRETRILGFSMFTWVISFAVMELAVMFFKRFFGESSNKEG